MDITKLDSSTLIICKKEDLQEFAEQLISKGRSEKAPTPQQTEIEQPITQPEALKFLGKSRQTFSKWRREGRIKGHRIGGRIYFFKSELVATMKS